MPIEWPSFIVGGIVAILARFLWDAWMEYRREKLRKKINHDIQGVDHVLMVFTHIPTSALTDDDASNAITALEKEWREKMMDNS